MSLYNLLFGFSQEAPLVLGVLDLSQSDVPRFRNAYIDKEGKCLAIYTRTGGGNREWYDEGNSKLQEHPNYISDEDDDFDCTYATFYFSFPEKYKQELEALCEGNETITPSKQWEELFAKLTSSEELSKDECGVKA